MFVLQAFTKTTVSCCLCNDIQGLFAHCDRSNARTEIKRSLVPWLFFFWVFEIFLRPVNGFRHSKESEYFQQLDKTHLRTHDIFKTSKIIRMAAMIS